MGSHAIQSFERSYLLCADGRAEERVQFMYMRMAIGIHGNHINDILETYELLSTRKISMASPVIWNSGLAKRNFSSCYIFDPFAVEPNDAISNFTDLSKLWAADGGIGIHAGEIPATQWVRFVTNVCVNTYDVSAQSWLRRVPSWSNAVITSVRLVGRLLVPVEPTPFFIRNCTSSHMACGCP